MRTTKLTLILVIFCSHILFSQKRVRLLESSVLVSMPVVLKEGKDPKIKEVKIDSYIICHEIASEQIFVGKYVESYKGERIKELIFDIKWVSNEYRYRYKNSARSEITTKIILSTIKSQTVFKDICCPYKGLGSNRWPVYNIKSEGPSRSIKKETYYVPNGITLKQSLFEPSTSEQLSASGFEEETIQHFNEVNEYFSDTYGEIPPYQKMTSDLFNQNRHLLEELKSEIYNVYGSKLPDIRSYTYFDKDGTMFNVVKEEFMWKPYYRSGQVVFEHRPHLKITYPSDSPYAGEVRLMNRGQNKPGRQPFYIMDVYQSTTQSPVPYNVIVISIEDNSDKVSLYGMDGSFNGMISADEFENSIKQGFTEAERSYGKPYSLAYYQRIYENQKFVNDYIKREIPVRSVEKIRYLANKDSSEGAFVQARMARYAADKKASLEKNGYFLETLDKNRPDFYMYHPIKMLFKGDGKRLYRLSNYEKAALVNRFMRLKATKCRMEGQSGDIVQIYDDVCLEETKETVNGLTVRSWCSEWGEKPSGLYASKRLYEAFEKTQDNLGSALDLFMTFRNPREGEEARRNIQKIDKDMRILFQLNECNSKALDRFEENLTRFINGEELIKSY